MRVRTDHFDVGQQTVSIFADDQRDEDFLRKWFNRERPAVVCSVYETKTGQICVRIKSLWGMSDEADRMRHEVKAQIDREIAKWTG